jgi:hypothetical protein
MSESPEKDVAPEPTVEQVSEVPSQQEPETQSFNPSDYIVECTKGISNNPPTQH